MAARLYSASTRLRAAAPNAAGTVPSETFEDGVIVNTILDACYRAMRSGTWEKVQYPS